MSLFIPSLAAVGYALISLFIFSRNRKQASNILFALGMLLMALCQGFQAKLLYDVASSREWISWARFSSGAELFALPVWLVFTLVFTREGLKRRLTRWKYLLIASLAGTLIFAYYLPGDKFLLLENGDVHLGVVGSLFMVYSILASSLILLNLEKIFQKTGRETRAKVALFLLGLSMLCGYFILKGSIGLVYSTLMNRHIPYLSALLIAGGSLVGYSVVRHRLLDVDVFLSRYVVYNSVSFLAVGSYLILVGVVSGWIHQIGDYFILNLLFLLTASFILAQLYKSPNLRYKAKLFINKNFFKYKHDFRDCWMEVIETIPRQKSVPEVREWIASLIKYHLRSNEVIFWYYQDKEFLKSGAVQDDDAKFKLEMSEEVITLILAKNTIVNTADNWMTIKNNPESKIYLTINPEFNLVVPVKFDDTILGIVTIHNNIVGEAYTPDDMDLVWAIARQGAATIVNLTLTGQLVAAKEGELFNYFSSFVIHDLKNFTQTLSLIMQNADDNMENEEFVKDAFRSIGVIVGKMNKITTNLSTISGRITPRLSKVEMVSWLKSCCSTFQVSLTAGSVTIEPDSQKIFIMLDTSLFEKVVHNFILNAQESRPEGTVTTKITLVLKAKFIIIKFADNGSGISPDFLKNNLFKPFRTTKSKGLGIGLFECKKIIDAHGGKIDVKSELQHGTTIKVILPV